VSAKKVKMTEMPQLVAIFNGFGGLASTFVAWAEFHQVEGALPAMAGCAILIAALIGSLTFSGSFIAYAKLAEKIDGKAVILPNQKNISIGIIAGIIFFSILAFIFPAISYVCFLGILVLGLALGVISVNPIGGADMPVVICLLNSYSGIAASAAGFIIANNVLIVSGSLVGASGIILTSIMCKAMNRSLGHVLFSGFGSETEQKHAGYVGEPNPINTEDSYYLLEAASSVLFIPGYGMAVSQAQHAVRELSELLEANGTEVNYCIHPVAGRMPGHMNVLLAEANVPYEQLVEPDDSNPIMDTVDVAVVIGANDVVNPAARDDESSPLYGMPIINADLAKTCIVLKRSMKSGFAGVDNPLFFGDNTRMLFGDAKGSIAALAAEFKDNQSSQVA
jgi:NAD(P) transhydrogenase subunit beta